MLQLMLRAAVPREARFGACRRLSQVARRGLRTSASAHGEPVAPPSAADEWEGLRSWRAAGVNSDRRWGANGPEAGCAPGEASYADVALPPSLAECGRLVLSTPDPKAKAALTHAAFRAWCAGSLPVGTAAAPDAPARPARPKLVPMKQVPTLAESLLSLPAHMLHTLAHIELNAVDLAWDTAVRFSSLSDVLPQQFFADWARVADDESRHLGWCLARLEELGVAYGDEDAHNQLWLGAEATAGDVLDRLVVVPCVQEARGLDAGPRLAARLVGAGDVRSAAIVRKIAAEEWAHVAVGVSWLRMVCKARSVDPGDAFRDAVVRHVPDGLKGPFERHARERVGLPRDWWDLAAAAEAPARPRRRSRASGNRDALAGVHARLERVVAMEAQGAAGSPEVA